MTETPSKDVRVRYAPSPTGHWHLGGARTALFNWVFARQMNGKFVIRIEDTDKARFQAGSEEEIFEIWHWLGLDYDESPQKGEYGPYRQSERLAIYRTYLERLLAEGKAYYCYCTKEELQAEHAFLAAQGSPQKYSGRCGKLSEPPTGKSPQAIRFRIPETTTEFTDIVRGPVSFDTKLFGDVIIAKDLDSPLYNFAVVVDDELMHITHVLRGEEHLGNTPRQILMQRALGFKEPVYAHLPLILAADRSKLSKRSAETSMISYRDAGYLPDALVNFLVLLGWHPKGDREIFSKDEIIKEFDLKRVQKAGAIFNNEKLDWLNREYMKKYSDEELHKLLMELNPPITHRTPDSLVLKALHVVRERMNTLRDFDELAAFFFELPDYEPELLIWKDGSAEQTADVLKKLAEFFESPSEQPYTVTGIQGALVPLTEHYGRGNVFWPLRVAVSGQKASPDPVQIVHILGPTETVARLRIAEKKLKTVS